MERCRTENPCDWCIPTVTPKTNDRPQKEPQLPLRQMQMQQQAGFLRRQKKFLRDIR